MYLIVNKSDDRVVVKEIDGRIVNEHLFLSSKLGQALLKVAYNSPNGTVEYK